jgi:hypothetical protein
MHQLKRKRCGIECAPSATGFWTATLPSVASLDEASTEWITSDSSCRLPGAENLTTHMAPSLDVTSMTCKHKWHVEPARTYTSGGCCQTNYRHRDSFCLTRWVIAGCIGLWLCTWTSGVGVEESTTEAAKYEMRQRYVACAAAGRVRRCGEEGATVRRRGRGGEVKGRGGEVKAFVTPTHIRPNLILIQPHHFSSRQLVRQPSTRQ